MFLTVKELFFNILLTAHSEQKKYNNYVFIKLTTNEVDKYINQRKIINNIQLLSKKVSIIIS